MAIPREADAEQRASLLRFLEMFAAQVFQSGGSIIHGSHPSTTPTLLEIAQRHVTEGGRRDCLTLAVSRFYSKDKPSVPVDDWRKQCVVYETPDARGISDRDESLRVLREWMACRCDAFVAVGGDWWHEISGRAGIPIEAGLAISRGLPCFLLGGLGGAAADYVETHPEVIRSLHNGLDVDENRRLATCPEVFSLAEAVLEQLTRLPLVHGRITGGSNFRILALDGGGVKGAFTAAVLATLEQSLGVSVVDHFDMIAGTSTGGILALGLASGMSGDAMVEFYRKRGPSIFPMMRFDDRLLAKIKHVFGVKFSQKSLYKELRAAYDRDGKPTYLREAQCRLVIPAYDAVAGVCHVFRTPHHPALQSDAGVETAQVALATAAAPTYFRAAGVRNQIANMSYFDGGVWANCPAMAAIVEAVCYLDQPIDRLDILSIGTTNEPFTVAHMRGKGLFGWRSKIVELLMHAQMDTSLRHAERLVGSPRFLRIDATVPPNIYALDKPSEIENLIALGRKIGAEAETILKVKSRFLNGVGVMEWRQHAQDAYEEFRS